jgi:hypothetical protein
LTEALPLTPSRKREGEFRSRRWLSRGAAVVAACVLFAAALAGRAQPPSELLHYRRIDLPGPDGVTTERVLVSFPRRVDRGEHPPGQRYPVLIALHGAGESRDRPERGHLAWITRYSLEESFAWLLRGRLSRASYGGFARDEHVEQVNASLRARPFGGLMVVTPYLPDLVDEPLDGARTQALGAWLAGPLLARVRQELPGAARTREGTGIDGVSLGGRIALEIGFAHSEAFGAVGALQPAITGRESALADRAVAASRQRPQRLRLLSSDDDPFLGATRRMSDALRERRLTHTLTVVPGPHDYAFNRGPGGIEMLLFHDRALAREPF